MNRLMRAMKQSDLSLVIDIENRAFTHPWPKQAFDELISHYARVLELDGKLIGYILCHVIMDEAVVLNFAIDPTLHGAGHGDYLFAESLKELRALGSRIFYLDVRESNVPAIGLYQKYGFSKIGIRKDYYSEPTENAIVMALIRE